MSLAPVNPQNTAPAFDLAHLFSFLWQKKFRIIATALAISLIGAFHIAQLDRYYRASSTILLDTNKQNFSLPDPVSTFTAGGDVQLETYIEYMRSHVFLEKIVADLDLTQYPEFRSKKTNASEQRHKDYAVSLLLYKLSISRLGETNLLKISYESLSPQIAADIANQVGPAFFEFLDELNKKRADEASEWLTNHIAELQEKLSLAEEAYQAFLKDNQMIDTSSQIGIANREISSLYNQRGENNKQIADFERTLGQIKAADGDMEKLMSIPRFLSFPILVEINSKIAAQSQYFAELKDRYKYKHPKYIQAQSNIDQLLADKQAAIKQFIGAIEQDYGTLKLNGDAIDRQINAAMGDLSELGADELALNRLKREVVSTQKVYDAFLARLQETEILRELGQNEQYAVVDVASVPTSPSKPRLTLLAAVTVLLSVFLSAGFWLAIHIINDNVTRYRSLLDKLAIPVLAEIPRIAGFKLAKPSAKTRANKHNSYAFAEAIRSLRTSLIVADKDKTARIILVAGIHAGDGKTTLGLSLAKAFGQLNKTLILDADLRTPRMQALFGLIDDHPGFSDFINRRAKFSESVQKVADTQLTIMPGGTPPADPLLDLSKNRVVSFMEKLAVMYDRVIIVAPPIANYSDALVLAKYADTSVIVCDADNNDSDDIVDAVQRMQYAGASSIGVVFNKSKSVRAQLPRQSIVKRAQKKMAGALKFA